MVASPSTRHDSIVSTCSVFRAVPSQVLALHNSPLPLGEGLGACEGVCHDHARNCSRER